MNFGYLLRTLRICAGLSLRELARSIDVSPTYLSLIETGKQPPPSASRIARIEKTLEVPPGYLLSAARGFDPTLLTFIQNIPEVIDFLQVASDKHLSADDFIRLTAFLNANGGEKLREALEKKCSFTEAGPAEKLHNGSNLWSFLQENLVFDMDGIPGKELFLREAVSRICCQCNGIDADAILLELLRREKIASTGIGRGIAVPHAYVAGLEQMIVAFVRIPQGLEFHAIDGEPVRMALFLAGPRSSKNLHLLLLARVAKLARNRDFCKRVLCAPGPLEIITIFRDAETAFP